MRRDQITFFQSPFDRFGVRNLTGQAFYAGITVWTLLAEGADFSERASFVVD